MLSLEITIQDAREKRTEKKEKGKKKDEKKANHISVQSLLKK
jgi:hypothetical protein